VRGGQGGDLAGARAGKRAMLEVSFRSMKIGFWRQPPVGALTLCRQRWKR
jgi:hypothetical protein